jgi:Pvc16 N-terminal domain
MSASTAIGDVTRSLFELLRNGQNPRDSFDISLRSPADETIDENRPKINLYLFRIEENAFAKNRDWQVVGNNLLHRTPLTLNLFYVVTPYARQQEDGHRVLGEAMRILYDNAVIDPSSLRGALEHTADPLKVDLCSFDLEDLTRVWNAFNISYRLSVCYQVRIVFIDSTIDRNIVRVTEKVSRFEENR